MEFFKLLTASQSVSNSRSRQYLKTMNNICQIKNVVIVYIPCILTFRNCLLFIIVTS